MGEPEDAHADDDAGGRATPVTRALGARGYFRATAVLVRWWSHTMPRPQGLSTGVARSLTVRLMVASSQEGHMANDTKATPVAQVVAGTSAKMFTVKTVAGERKVAETPLFPAGKVIDLSDEGPLTFVDVTEKGQVARKLKLAETPRAHPTILFFSETEKKYGGVVACRMCGDGVRKWTSDMHQSFYCGACGVKAKRAASKAKRAAKADDK